MRPVLALTVVVVLLSGLKAYMVFRPLPTRAPDPVEHQAPGIFELEITLTFDAGPDAFAVNVADSPSLLVTFRGEDVLRRKDTVFAGEAQRVTPVDGLVQGANEFFVQASPADQSAQVARAVRVRVLRDGHPIAEESLWSEPGEIVQGTIEVVTDVDAPAHKHP